MEKKVVLVAFKDTIRRDKFETDGEYFEKIESSMKQYAYFTDIEGIAVKDLVVVPVNASAAMDSFKIATVTKVIGLTHGQMERATKWIVQKVDTQAYFERIKKQELIQEIKNQLHKRIEEMREIVLFQQLAGSDPVIKELLNKLTEIDPSLVPAIDETKKSELE